MQVIASIEGYNGESILIKDLDTESDENGVFVEVTKGDKGIFKGWLRVSYKMVEDGTYNQSVHTIPLPYIVIGRDVYSIEDFHYWDN